MPRRRAPPRLYLDPARRDWVIRDGASFIRTGFGEHDRERAEKRLAEYLGAKWEPERGPDPLIADVLNIYAREHLAHAATARNSSYSLTYLLRWWGTRHTSAVTPANCRAYAAAATSMATARKDLELLKAALRHYTRSTGIVLQTAVVLPRKAAPRTRWLTRSEAARLLWAARRLPHLSRFIRLALATGSRPGVLFRLRWDQIDLGRGLLYRRPHGQPESATKRAPPVKLGRKILGHLRRWRKLDRAEWIVHYDGQPIKQFSNSWPTVIERAGLPGVSLHTLRHTRATWTVQAGVPIWEAAGFLGMTPATLSATYGHHSPDFQSRAADI